MSSFEDTYLPDCLKDFNDQKDTFKAMHHAFQQKFKDSSYQMPNWVEGQIYCIDFFLWFMAHHGYKLQRWKAKVEFADLNKTIEEYKSAVAVSLDHGRDVESV